MGTRDDLRDSIAAPDAQTTADYDRATTEQALPHEPTDEQLEQMAAEVREFIGNYLGPHRHRRRRRLPGAGSAGVPDAALREIDRTRRSPTWPCGKAWPR